MRSQVIKIRKPSKEISRSYDIKSENSLNAAKLLLKNNFIEESITMSYYSMYHKATSLLRLAGIKCENHKATIIILKELFKINNEFISDAKDKRINSQYYSDFSDKKEDSKFLIKQAEKFLAIIDFYKDELIEEDIIKIIIKLREAVN
ncbi:MAG: HEPN domain-containing protein [Candidatus Woesearchaeota archaeon]